MRRSVLVALAAAVVVVVLLGVGFMIALQGPSQARDEFGSDLTYRDPARTEPIAARLTYRQSGERTEEFRLVSRDESVPVQWSVSEGGSGGEAELWQGARLVQRQTLSATGCATWSVDEGSEYVLRVTVASGAGTIELAWQEAARC